MMKLMIYFHLVWKKKVENTQKFNHKKTLKKQNNNNDNNITKNMIFVMFMTFDDLIMIVL